MKRYSPNYLILLLAVILPFVAYSQSQQVKRNSSPTKSKTSTDKNGQSSKTNTGKKGSKNSTATKAQVKISDATGYINGHGYVDLGLSVKWATCNVGASNPSDYGNYYAWGETEPKSTYTKDNSVTYGKEVNDIGGTQYDVAHTEWGGNWRMPTNKECRELNYQCDWQWVIIDGHYGYKVTGPNGNSIFLPAAGYRKEDTFNYVGTLGNYWSSTPYTHDYYAWEIRFDDSLKQVSWINRDCGRSVRPVIE